MSKRNLVVQNGQLLKVSVLAASLVCAGPALADRDMQLQDSTAYYAQSYQLPDPVNPIAMNESIRWGKALAPGASEYADAQSNIRTADGKSYEVNRPTKQGTWQNMLSWLVGVKKAPPVAFSSRQNRYRALPLRSNACLERALAGETEPVNSHSMQDIIDYCGLLGTGLQSSYFYQQLSGQESSELPNMNRVTDPQLDQKIYPNHCTSCHLDF